MAPTHHQRIALPPPDAPAPLQRMDTEDLATLGQMLQLGAAYIDEQDEPEDQKNIAPMQEALGIIGGLVPVELAEAEPEDEPEDESDGE